MGPRSLLRCVPIAASVLVLAISVSAGSVAAQSGGVCDALTADDLSAAVAGTFDAPVPFPEGCQWHGSSAGGGAVDLMVVSTAGSPDDFDVAGGLPSTVAGFPALSISDATVDPPTAGVVIDLDGNIVLLTLSSDDAAVDLAGAASALAEVAVPRLVETTSDDTAASDGDTSTSDGDSAAGQAAVAPCELATPAEIAAALGLDVKLKLQDYEVACDYQGGKGKNHIAVYVQTQDPTTFDGMIASVGATEVDGPGDTNWWWTDYASLFSRQGDLVLQVAIQTGKDVPDAKLQSMATSIMETLLAP
jgi:hypothetical protein